MLTLLFNQGAPVNVTAAGVSANAAIGAGQIDVTFALTGVAAAPAIGATRIDVDLVLSGVAASPAIGTGTILLDLIVQLAGVSASPAIGATRIDVDFPSSGVSASPATGNFIATDVGVPLSGAGGSPAIGSGAVQGAITTETSSGGRWFGFHRRKRPSDTLPSDFIVRVFPVGVAARPTIGEGAIEITVSSGSTSARSAIGATRIHVDLAIARGVAANVQLKRGPLFISRRRGEPENVEADGVSARAKIGRGRIINVVDLYEEEILALLLAA